MPMQDQVNFGGVFLRGRKSPVRLAVKALLNS
jgi:hypothetical protein